MRRQRNRLRCRVLDFFPRYPMVNKRAMHKLARILCIKANNWLRVCCCRYVLDLRETIILFINRYTRADKSSMSHKIEFEILSHR